MRRQDSTLKMLFEMCHFQWTSEQRVQSFAVSSSQLHTVCLFKVWLKPLAWYSTENRFWESSNLQHNILFHSWSLSFHKYIYLYCARKHIKKFQRDTGYSDIWKINKHALWKCRNWAYFNPYLSLVLIISKRTQMKVYEHVHQNIHGLRC